MPSMISLKALGLNTSPNGLEPEDGTLDQASNIIIRRDNVIESRRGFKLYGNNFGTASDRAKQLATYKDRILRHYSDKLQFDDGSGNFSIFDGSFLETETGLRIKSIESNGNFFFTTSEGIKKISAKTSSQLSTSSGYITQAGGIKAVDLTGRLLIELGDQGSFFLSDSAVAYRVVWGIKDANNNLILGTPSSRLEIYNSLQDLLIQDFSHVLGALDDINQSGSLINDGNYVSTLELPITSTAEQLRTNLISLVTKIDNDILYADNDGLPTGAPLEINTATITAGVCTVDFASGTATDYFTAGSKIYLDGFTPGTGTLNGAQIVTNVTATSIDFNTTATGLVTISPSATIVSNEYRSITQPSTPSSTPTNDELLELQTYLDAIILQLQTEPNAVIPTALADDFITPLAVTNTATVELTITIPEDVTLNHFVQVYRSAVTSATGAINISDIAPNDELQLIYEAYPTQAELDVRTLVFEDITPDLFRGANLYTNPITGEGILQANDIPPFAKDINKFKNTIFYANTKTRQRKSISLLGVTNMIADFNNSIIPNIVISNADSSNTYNFVTGIAEVTEITCGAGATLESGANPASYFLINSAEDKTEYYVWYEIGSATDPMVSGKTGIKVVADASDTDAQIAQKTRNTLSRFVTSFTATVSTNVVTVTNNDFGYTTDASDGTSGFTFNVTADGRGEKVTQENTLITCVADVAGSLAGDYFTLNTAFNRNQYYVWYKVSGVGVDPMVANKIGIQVDIVTNDSATNVATATKNTLNDLENKFIATSVGADLTVKNFDYGPANDATAGTSGFTVVIQEDGALEVLLSTLVSPAQAVDQTARSLVRVINKNTSEAVYAYYLSGAQDVPGKILLESRALTDNEIYLLANNSNTGLSFNPDISPEITISSIATGSETTMLITTSTPHGLINQDMVVISNTNSTPNIDGLHEIVYVSATTFRVQVAITSAGTTGSLIKADNAEFSENEVKPNRIYYSKLQQPEAVPIVNFFDVGAENKEILRIFPLRDSLFVFKEDGLFRVSGELAPFSLGLFDSSCIAVAPDSVDVANNLVYCWTTQGISTVSESGVEIISRPIDDQLLKLSSFNYPGFKTATWGIGYDSDNSYLVWTVKSTADTIAKICYRFSNLTNTWTTFDKTNTCGIVNPTDDRVYLGAGDTNFIEQERKTFTRLDYADRELDAILSAGNYFGDRLKLTSIDGYAKGDAVVQEQKLTTFEFNTILKKLDLDSGVAVVNVISITTGSTPTITTVTDHNVVPGDFVRLLLTNSVPIVDGIYEVVTAPTSTTFTIELDDPITVAATSGFARFQYYDTLSASGGDDLRLKIVDLANKLDTDPGVVDTDYFTTIENKTGSITANSADNPTQITSAAHGLFTGRIVTITGSNSIPSIDGTYEVTVLDANTFTIPISVVVPGTSGSFVTVLSDFDDIEACHNKIMTKLNADTGVAFSNYPLIDTETTLEAVILDIDVAAKELVLNMNLEFVLGDLIIFKSIKTEFTYSPITMGDALSLKHIREATVMFENKAFTNATLSIASDLLPEFKEIEFNGTGNGIFGTNLFGEGFFGGASHSAPFRTYIPRQCQRCRYLVLKYRHNIAREQYAIYGITLTGEVAQSSRAYR